MELYSPGRLLLERRKKKELLEKAERESPLSTYLLTAFKNKRTRRLVGKDLFLEIASLARSSSPFLNTDS